MRIFSPGFTAAAIAALTEAEGLEVDGFYELMI